MTHSEDPDDTLTIEEAAILLKVNSATVQRELRAGRLPGNTVGRLWRIRRADLREYLKGPPPLRVTEGELAFEVYLESVGLPFAFEEPVPGTAKRPDYRLTLDERASRFEVKQFDPRPEDFRSGAGMINPYPPLREKIESARKKFKGLKGMASCSLVLYNNGRPFIFLDPTHVYGAMLGDVGFTFPFDPKTGHGDVSQLEHAFLGGGKMHRYEKGTINPIASQNTTISAIVVVCGLDIGYRRMAIAIALRERELGRDLSFDERVAMMEDWSRREPGLQEGTIRVRVYENPYAEVPLSPSFAMGAWDERFGAKPSGTNLTRLRVGSALEALEAEQTVAGIKVDPWEMTG